MILCINPNTNIERTWIIPGLHFGGTCHVQEILILPSGKGVNVARSIKILQGEASCAGFLGGYTGRWIESLVQQAGIPARWTWIEGESRIALVIFDPEVSDEDATLISEQGPTVGPQDWKRLQEDVLVAAEGLSLACLSGSLPVGSPLDEYIHLIRLLETRGIEVWVDATGTVLEAALHAKPSGIKINGSEAAQLLGRQVADVSEARIAAQALAEWGPRRVCITLDAHGAVLFTGNGFCHATTPPTQIKSTVGSGDAFLAGLLLSLDKDQSFPDSLRAAAAAGAANTLELGGGRFNLSDFRRLLNEVVIEEI